MTLIPEILRNSPQLEVADQAPARPEPQQQLVTSHQRPPLRLIASNNDATAQALPLHERYAAEFKAYAAAMGAQTLSLKELGDLLIPKEKLDQILRGEVAKYGGEVFYRDPTHRNRIIAVDGNKLPAPYSGARPDGALETINHYVPPLAFAKHAEVAGWDPDFIAGRYLTEPEQRLTAAREELTRAQEALRTSGSDEALCAIATDAVEIATREVQLAETHHKALRDQYRVMRKVLGATQATEDWFEKHAQRPRGAMPSEKLEEFNDRAWRLSTRAAVEALAKQYLEP